MLNADMLCLLSAIRYEFFVLPLFNNRQAGSNLTIRFLCWHLWWNFFSDTCKGSIWTILIPFYCFTEQNNTAPLPIIAKESNFIMIRWGLCSNGRCSRHLPLHILHSFLFCWAFPWRCPLLKLQGDGHRGNYFFLYLRNVIVDFYVFIITSLPESRATGIANSIIFLQNIGMVMLKIII